MCAKLVKIREYKKHNIENQDKNVFHFISTKVLQRSPYGCKSLYSDTALKQGL